MLVPQSQFLPCGPTYLTGDFGRGNWAGPVFLLLVFLLRAAAAGSSPCGLLLIQAPEWGGPQGSSTACAWGELGGQVQYSVVRDSHTR